MCVVAGACMHRLKERLGHVAVIYSDFSVVKHGYSLLLGLLPPAPSVFLSLGPAVAHDDLAAGHLARDLIESGGDAVHVLLQEPHTHR